MKTLLEYVFHADRSGEDIYFWLENPRLHPCLAKQIRIQPRKTVLLEQRLDLIEDPIKARYIGIVGNRKLIRSVITSRLSTHHEIGGASDTDALSH